MSEKRMLITGASCGLGAHLATRMLDKGWSVIATGRRPHPPLPSHPALTYIQADLSNELDVLRLIEFLVEVPDIIVHNAVKYPKDQYPAGDIREIESLFRVNAIVPYYLSLQLLESKPTDRFCSFVTINSEAMYHADERSGVYGATKAALRVLTSALSSACRGRNASASTLLLGPLADTRKLDEVRSIAERRGMDEREVVKLFLRKSNPDLVIEDFISFDACLDALLLLIKLGSSANGMVCKLDGGASGSLS